MARSLVALLLFASSLGGLTLVSLADQYANGGVAWGPLLPPRPPDSPQIPYTDVNPLGVNTFFEKEVDPAKLEKSAQMIRDGGFRWVRQGFSWNDIEISGKGNYLDTRNPGVAVDAWAKYDRLVDISVKYGLQIIARLDSPPVWARMPGDDVEKFRKGPPARNEDYGDFVEAVVSRYKGKIKYFQIWNEPNLYGEWGGHPVSPKEYTALLKEAYTRAKRANPDAVILSAALAPTAEDSVANLNDVLFLEGMYREGAAPYFDILSTMLYGLGQPPTERRTDLKRLNFSRPILLRRVMEQFGDVKTPIWISEYAWISLPPGWEEECAKRDAANPCGTNIWGKSVDEQTQARWEVEGYQRAQSEWPWMGPMMVWYFREPDPRPQEPANYFAIVRPDFTPRPAYDALKAYSSRFPAQGTAGVVRPVIEKPLWNALGFPLLYLLFSMASVLSAGFGASTLGRWAGAALDRPRGRYSEAAREVARNGALVVGMALLVGLYYTANSLPLMLGALALWGLLAVLKPSAGLAAVAFSIPFFWVPKALGQQRFPIAETLLVLTFAAVLARRIGPLLPGLARRQAYRRAANINRPPVTSGNGTGLIDNRQAPFAARSRALDDYHHTLDSPRPVDEKATAPLPIPNLHPQPQVRDDALQPARWPPRPASARVGVKTYGAEKIAVLPEVEAPPVPPAVEEDGGHPVAQTGIAQPGISLPRPRASEIKARFLGWYGREPFSPPAVAILIIGTLSLLTLADPAFAKDSARFYRWTIVLPVLFYFLLTDVIRSRRGLMRVVDFFTAAAVGVSLYGLWQFFVSDNTLEVEGVSRVFSVYQHPNNLALYLGRVFPFAACLALFLPWGWRKTLYALALLPLGATFVLTYSRGAWAAVALALLISVAVGVITRPRRTESRSLPRWAVPAAGTALLILVLLATVVIPRLPERILSFESGSMRVLHWQSSLRMIADRPVFGIGLDQFLNQFQAREVIASPEECEKLYTQHPRQYIVSAAQCREFYTAHPHNFLLDAWLSLGIIGLLVFLWLLWTYFREAFRAVRQASAGSEADPVYKALAVGLLASMIDFLVHGMVDNSYFLMDLAMIFWLSCGLLQIVRGWGSGIRDQGSGIRDQGSGITNYELRITN